MHKIMDQILNKNWGRHKNSRSHVIVTCIKLAIPSRLGIMNCGNIYRHICAHCLSQGRQENHPEKDSYHLIK